MEGRTCEISERGRFIISVADAVCQPFVVKKRHFCTAAEVSFVLCCGASAFFLGVKLIVMLFVGIHALISVVEGFAHISDIIFVTCAHCENHIFILF